MNDVKALRVFVRVAELCSFSLAAEQLGLPRATVSDAVRQLEATMGAQLLHRTTRRVQLTPDGQALLQRSLDLLADLDELSTLFRPAGQALQGRLRVDLPLATARHVVLPRLPEFMAAHPALQIELSSTDRRVDLVREGFDCVLRVGGVGDPLLVARPLGFFSQINCASPAYLARMGLPQSLEDLAGHQLIHYSQSLSLNQAGFEVALPGGGLQRVAMAGALTVNNAEAYQGACLASLGLIQAPAVGFLADLLARGELIEVLPQWRAPPLPVTLLVANRRHLARRVRVFMDWLAEVMAPHLAPA